jgi:hypothetical protein
MPRSSNGDYERNGCLRFRKRHQDKIAHGDFVCRAGSVVSRNGQPTASHISDLVKAELSETWDPKSLAHIIQQSP